MRRLLQRYLDMRLRNKLLLSYVVIILLVGALILGAGRFITRPFMEQKALGTAGAVVGQMRYGFEATVANIEENLFNKSINSPFINYQFTPGGDNPAAAPENRQKYQRAAEYLLHSQEYYAFVYFADVYGTQMVTREDDFTGEAVPYVRLLDAQALEEEAQALKLLWGNSQWRPGQDGVVYLKRAVYDINTLKYSGYIVVGIRTGALGDLLTPAGAEEAGTVMALTEDGEVLAAPAGTPGALTQSVVAQLAATRKSEKEGVLRFEEGGTGYVAAFARTQNSRFTLVNLISVKDLTRDYAAIQRINMFICVLGLGIAAVFGLVISSNVTDNVHRLLSRMNEVSQGDFSGEIAPTSRDEIGQLAGQFNQMSARIQGLMEDVKRESTRKQQMEYQLLESKYHNLQQQLNPHFLYNVLDSVNSLAKLEGQEAISEVVCLLSELLRENVSRTTRLVPLGDEVAYVQKYTKLYEIMYGDKVAFEYQPDLIKEVVPVPTFILQPIVENAIIHGVERRPGKGTIRITATRREACLVLQVADDGAGMAPEALRQIMDEKAPAADGSHIGIASVQDRLHLLFGEGYGLEIDSREGAGTTVRIVLPQNPEPLL